MEVRMSKKNRAFTLTELMVTIGMSLIILLSVGFVLVHALKTLRVAGYGLRVTSCGLWIPDCNLTLEPFTLDSLTLQTLLLFAAYCLLYPRPFPRPRFSEEQSQQDNLNHPKPNLNLIRDNRLMVL